MSDPIVNEQELLAERADHDYRFALVLATGEPEVMINIGQDMIWLAPQYEFRLSPFGGVRSRRREQRAVYVR